MLDAIIRKQIEPPLAVIARQAMKWRISAQTATVLAFVLGLAAAGLVVAQLYAAAAVALLVSRGFDALDGAIARQTQMTSLGSYLDSVFDLIVYVTLFFAFALADPAQNALAAAFVTSSMLGSMASYLVFGIVAHDFGVSTELRGALRYFDGLTEGAETIGCLTLMCIFPSWFATIAIVFAVLCWITAGARVAGAMTTFGEFDRAQRAVQ